MAAKYVSPAQTTSGAPAITFDVLLISPLGYLIGISINTRPKLNSWSLFTNLVCFHHNNWWQQCISSCSGQNPWESSLTSFFLSYFTFNPSGKPWVLSKYIQNLATSYYHHCCHSGLSHYHLLPRFIQWFLIDIHAFNLAPESILSTIAKVISLKLKIRSYQLLFSKPSNGSVFY